MGASGQRLDLGREVGELRHAQQARDGVAVTLQHGRERRRGVLEQREHDAHGAEAHELLVARQQLGLDLRGVLDGAALAPASIPHKRTPTNVSSHLI